MKAQVLYILCLAKCGILLEFYSERQLTFLINYFPALDDYYNYDYGYGNELPVEVDDNVKGY